MAGLTGAAGQYVSCQLNPGGFDCLQGFGGDPSTYPDAPAHQNAITTGFSWNPIGRTCSWNGNQPAATNGNTTTIAISHQTDHVSSNWIHGTAAAGAGILLVTCSTTAARKRMRHLSKA